MKTDYKPGDYIYYYKKNSDKTFDTIPGIVVKATNKCLYISCSGEKPIRVLKSNCELQSDRP